MPRRNRRKKAKAKKNRRRKPKARRRGGRSRLNPYASMVADPCNAVLAPGFYGDQEGMLARARNTTFNPGVTNSCGYILWSPDYHTWPDTLGGAAPAGPANVYVWGSVDPNLSPLNTIATPFGTAASQFGAGEITTAAIDDPAGAILLADVVQDARTISSCLQMSYTGRLTESSGEMCYVEALSLDAVLRGSSAGLGLPVPVNVNDLFKYATKSERFGIDTFEILSRPSESSDLFRSDQIGTHTLGNPATVATVDSEESKAQQPTFYGFAWRGVDTTSPSPTSFILTKNMEWRPSPVSGLAHAPPRAINPTSMAQQAVRALDAAYGSSWSTRFKNTAQSLGSSLAQAAFTGVTGGHLEGETSSGGFLNGMFNAGMSRALSSGLTALEEGFMLV